jgi:hypothetical protein
MTVDPDRLELAAWLDVVQHEYLDTFMAEGGSSVKVVVANPEKRRELCERMREIATSRGYSYAHVDAATRKLHLVQNVFNEIAAQLPWNSVAETCVRRAIEEQQYDVPENGDLSVHAVAERNDDTKNEVMRGLRKFITKNVARDYKLGREFRVAVAALCRSVYEAGTDQTKRAEYILEWFSGTLAKVSLLELPIYRKIGRNNARQALVSTSAWFSRWSGKGLVLTIDFSRYALGKSVTNGLSYTKPATLDMHEVLRQFIDSADEFHSTMLIFLTGEEFLTNDDRGLRNYDALRLRLTDDVKDRYRANPFAPMVRLAAGGE